MKKLILAWLTLLFIGARTAHAAQIQIVPGGLANVEGNSSSLVPFGLGSSYFQQVISASEFDFGGQPTGRIERIWFRLDANAGSNMNLAFGLGIAMSTTSHSPDSLSPNFVDNIGPDQISVVSGITTFSTPYTSGVQPQPFLFGIQLRTPFYYSPARGHLLVEIHTSQGIGNPVPLDAQSTMGDWTSSVFDNTGAGLSGMTDTRGLVFRLDVVPIPEPSIYVLLAGFAFAFLIHRGMRKDGRFNCRRL